MCGSCVLVHCFSRLGAAATLQATKDPCRNGVFAEYTFECAKAAHHFDRVMSHSFSVVAYPAYHSKLKFNSRLSTTKIAFIRWFYGSPVPPFFAHGTPPCSTTKPDRLKSRLSTASLEEP
jgi:hypothetical protein